MGRFDRYKCLFGSRWIAVSPHHTIKTQNRDGAQVVRMATPWRAKLTYRRGEHDRASTSYPQGHASY